VFSVDPSPVEFLVDFWHGDNQRIRRDLKGPLYCVSSVIGNTDLILVQSEFPCPAFDVIGMLIIESVKDYLTIVGEFDLSFCLIPGILTFSFIVELVQKLPFPDNAFVRSSLKRGRHSGTGLGIIQSSAFGQRRSEAGGAERCDAQQDGKSYDS
jgi:hypothetical protein